MKTRTILLTAITMFFVVATKAQNSPWLLRGNTNINPSKDFLGTKDNSPLIFRTRNVFRMTITNGGQIGIGTVNPVQKLDIAGNINIEADSAFYIGNIKTLHTSGGTENFFVGPGTGNFIQTGGASNTSVGYQAMYFNSTGDRNTAIGDHSLWLLDPGNDNVAVGYNSLVNLEAGGENTAIGSNALGGLIIGGENIAIGYNAMSNTDGGLGIGQNIAIGTNTLAIHKFGDNTIAIGPSSLSSIFAGENNTAVGNATNVNDSFNISNSTALGNEALLTAANQIRIGNGSIESIGGYKNWTKISDARVKKNIKDNVPGLAFINKLKPVTYTVDLDAADKITQKPVIKTSDGKVASPSKEALAARKAEEKILQTGFVAQDVERAAKSLNYDFSGVDAAKNDKDLYGLRYAEFVVPLVKAVQELSSQNDALKKENDALEARLDKIEQALNISDAQKTNLLLSNAHLDQNIPNPANNSTTINYYLPQNTSAASLNISDANGKLLKTFSLLNNNGQVILQTNELRSGTYQYFLIVNGNIVDSKKMVISK